MTIAIGKNDKVQKDTYKKLLDISNAGVDKLRPGSKCSEIYKAMQEKVNKYKFDNCLFEGHGIGLSPREYPIISPNINYSFFDGLDKRSADFMIEKNMVVNLEIALHLLNGCDYSIERTFYITDSGCANITFQDRSKIFSFK